MNLQLPDGASLQVDISDAQKAQLVAIQEKYTVTETIPENEETGEYEHIVSYVPKKDRLAMSNEIRELFNG